MGKEKETPSPDPEDEEGDTNGPLTRSFDASFEEIACVSNKLIPEVYEFFNKWHVSETTLVALAQQYQGKAEEEAETQVTLMAELVDLVQNTTKHALAVQKRVQKHFEDLERVWTTTGWPALTKSAMLSIEQIGQLETRCKLLLRQIEDELQMVIMIKWFERQVTDAIPGTEREALANSSSTTASTSSRASRRKIPISRHRFASSTGFRPAQVLQKKRIDKDQSRWSRFDRQLQELVDKSCQVRQSAHGQGSATEHSADKAEGPTMASMLHLMSVQDQVTQFTKQALHLLETRIRRLDSSSANKRQRSQQQSKPQNTEASTHDQDQVPPEQAQASIKRARDTRTTPSPSPSLSPPASQI